jgi:subfamily B ATP-binding cassette protein MsbA
VALPGFQHSIEFRHLTFGYTKDKTVLNDINVVIPKGKTIALVGPSGGGKSTLADLIPRFYDPQQGEVCIDGKPLTDYQLESIRKEMGIVTQESILFNDTIFNNIAFGLENVSEEDVIRAAKVANAHEFIVRTENGYQTKIGERGSKLSGGQRQRLSIARAVLKNPPILILDEATSALDSESEKLVQDALTKLMENRTSIVIAHRLSTIQHADEILVIQEGKIMERGKHEQLMQQGGLYTKLTEIQKV